MSKQTIIIIGGGFAGLEFIKRFKTADDYQLILVDSNNYNFFPPLIYQVATGFMEPSAISYPYRKILRGLKNVRFRLGNLERVIPEEKCIELNNGRLHYDHLIMATGTETNFFGNKEIEANSLPMKTISDALSLRNTVFTRLDKATRTESKEDRKRLLTFVMAGAGPTGVELSGILAEMRTHVMRKDYPELDEEDLGDIYLIDAQETVLSAMSTSSQNYTHTQLNKLGVQVKLNSLVTGFDGRQVSLSDGSMIETENLIWSAGITARTFPGFSEDCFGPGRRLRTDVFNRIQGLGNEYALGDCAFVEGDPHYPNGHPQLAQAAIQQANNLAENLSKKKGTWKEFRYKDLGSLAIIGRNKAVFDTSGQKHFFKGFFAWFVWIFIHIMGLVNFKNKLRTFINWIGYYIYKDQYFRMIIKPGERKEA